MDNPNQRPNINTLTGEEIGDKSSTLVPQKITGAVMTINRRRFLALPAIGVPAMVFGKRLTADESYDIKYQLDCGRWVTVEECYISTSTLGYLAGNPENPRFIRHVIERLPEQVQDQFGGSTPYYIKPLPEGSHLPRFVFMAYLVSEPISGPESDGSKLIVCWLSDDITTSLPELIKRETRAIEWNKYAVDFGY